jgi:hypothetical protein
MFRYGIDAFLIAVVTTNYLAGRKTRRVLAEVTALREKLKKYHDERAPMLINAMEHMASGACPLCAVASGRGSITTPEGELTAEAEINGEHVIRITCEGNVVNDGVAECRAASIRADARKLFAETMEEKTAA